MIRPILASLSRHKAGVVLIRLQIALTLAIVCNALFIIHQDLTRLGEPSGLTEDHLIAIRTQFVGDISDYVPLIRTDVQALRSLPGVADAYAANSFPLRGGGALVAVQTSPDSRRAAATAAMYYGDEHALGVLGAKLIAGRNFTANEVGQVDRGRLPDPGVAIVTQALADRLFPQGSALGKAMYFSDRIRPIIVIGILERMEVPWTHARGEDGNQFSLLLPEITNNGNESYLVRAQPGEDQHVMARITHALALANPMRTMLTRDPVAPFSTIRRQAYRADRGMVILMSVVSVVLLAITGAGIAGLSSFWVGQRRRQIGVRRALGATRRDIIAYFLVENLLIGLGGVLVGCGLAWLLAAWLQVHFAGQRMPAGYLAVGTVVLLLLSQAAVLSPAVRASRISPIEATRAG
ncbi:ABC transporter permease [Luteibacter yeojuensis]|uniref:ABC transport system permease protein n=1 Tax=Luteibacter yeojuensis TaxID=345309 RepID=A0A0F3KWV5_9GAMM|nr:FtsX-like permease family protein [Luteibacter yeojuensis]KJV35698.1 hypothetical protein VI08_06765 [Luteibacter yeojuensis]